MRISIDDEALAFLKKELARDNASALRIFTGGGGCCGRFEVTPVRKGLERDAVFLQGGIKIYIEKELVEGTNVIEIKLDEQKGLLINFEQANP